MADTHLSAVAPKVVEGQVICACGERMKPMLYEPVDKDEPSWLIWWCEGGERHTTMPLPLPVGTTFQRPVAQAP